MTSPQNGVTCLFQISVASITNTTVITITITNFQTIPSSSPKPSIINPCIAKKTMAEMFIHHLTEINLKCCIIFLLQATLHTMIWSCKPATEAARNEHAAAVAMSIAPAAVVRATVAATTLSTLVFVAQGRKPNKRDISASPISDRYGN